MSPTARSLLRLTTLSLFVAACAGQGTSPNEPRPAASAEAAVPIPASSSVTSSEPNLLPRPAELRTGSEVWPLSAEQELRVSRSAEFAREADVLVQGLRALGLTARVVETDDGSVQLRRDRTLSAAEGYRLDVTSAGATLTAAEPAGAFYAVKSLLQVMAGSPAQASTNSADGSAQRSVPELHVSDAPRFAYRGLMLDVSRHFFSVEDIEAVLDKMADYKLNHFHWHLTDDQGWRLQIKKYPRLTSVGGTRKGTLRGHGRDPEAQLDSVPYGGFYTQEQIRHVVRYAAERHITVVPEIELPGHASAALTAYPELGCVPDKAYAVEGKWGIFEDIFCPHEHTFAFFENVLSEVLELFPSSLVHVGGDEVPKRQWLESKEARAVMQREGLKTPEELQTYFLKRVARFVEARGRRVVGWDEVTEGGVPEGVVVMSWRGESGGIAAARAGHDVIMTPSTHLYFDHYQSHHPEYEPLGFGGHTSLRTVYEYDPTGALAGDATAARHVLGTQANLWTEYVPNADHAEHMLFPRLLALSEVAWTAQNKRSFEDFSRRVLPEMARLQRAGVRVAPYFLDVTQTSTVQAGRLDIALHTPLSRPIRYTLDDKSKTDPSWQSYSGPLSLTQSANVTAGWVDEGDRIPRSLTESYLVGASTGLHVAVVPAPSPRFAMPEVLTNGRAGGVGFEDGQWLGVEGKDLELTLDLGQSTPLSAVSVGFLLDFGNWILVPREVEVLVSNDGKAFRSVAKVKVSPPSSGNITRPRVELGGTSARTIKLIVRNGGPLPKTHPGAGQPAWTFLDEVLVEASQPSP